MNISYSSTVSHTFTTNPSYRNAMVYEIQCARCFTERRYVAYGGQREAWFTTLYARGPGGVVLCDGCTYYLKWTYRKAIDD